MALYVLFLVFALQLLKPVSCTCSGYSGYSEDKYTVTNGWSSAPFSGRKKGGEKGVAWSESIAGKDLESRRLTSGIKKTIWHVASEKDVDPYIIVAIASRESNFGSPGTLKNGWGDNGNGYGWMQVDKNVKNRIVDTTGPSSKNHFLQAVGILVTSIKGVKNNHKDWEREYQIKGGIAGYNFGSSNVWTKDGIDRRTAGHDYSSDVLARAHFFRKERVF
ncbi:lysozyme g-like [Oscarella lobularis]|uniref:lysozyme g-like n=1 Tax=Oscarella lobularis TaxID=121494 RepID=UPI003314468F